MNKILLLLGFCFTSTAFAVEPLPVVGSGVPVNVLMCKIRADMEAVLKTAYTSGDGAFKEFTDEMEKSGRCTVGGGAKIVAVDDQPFLIKGTQRVHILEVQYGGESYFTNFNR